MECNWPVSWPKWKKDEYDYVVERDDGLCIVDLVMGCEIHHVLGRSKDEKETHNRNNMVVTCWNCHHGRAHGGESKVIRQICVEYLIEVEGRSPRLDRWMERNV